MWLIEIHSIWLQIVLLLCLLRHLQDLECTGRMTVSEEGHQSEFRKGPVTKKNQLKLEKSHQGELNTVRER